MKKLFEEPMATLFDLSSDEVMDVDSTEEIEYDKIDSQELEDDEGF